MLAAVLVPWAIPNAVTAKLWYFNFAAAGIANAALGTQILWTSTSSPLLAGVLFVLRTGVAWRDVPTEAVGCSGVTAWRRLRDWTEAGVWPRLHAALLAELRRAGRLDLDDCAVDGSHIRAFKGGIVSALRQSIGPAPAPSIT